ncbi:MAG TPA: TerC family protein [Chitinophagales bacterium]|nr:TerC family protein [Chitinophagales bacterium]
MDALLTPEALISLITLTFMEIVLGVDNIIFISIVAAKLPKEQEVRARNIGLSLALLFRIGLLLMITWIIGLQEPLFTLPLEGLYQKLGMEHTREAAEISWRDIILFCGGLFLLAKSTTEIHSKLEGHVETKDAGKKNAMAMVVFQIILLDMIFSIDSILTAIGLVQQVAIMIVAVIISIGMMLLFAGKISTFINRHPTIKMLALAFLLMIGFMLMLEGLAFHVPKGYIYVAIFFSLGVELLNMRMRKASAKAQ